MSKSENLKVVVLGVPTKEKLRITADIWYQCVGVAHWIDRTPGNLKTLMGKLYLNV